MPDQITLDNKRKTQLDANIKQMLDGGASQYDVEAYAKDFKNQFGVKKKVSTPDVKSTSGSSGTGSKSSQASQANTSKEEPQRKFQFAGEETTNAPVMSAADQNRRQQAKDEKLSSGLGLGVKPKTGLGSSLTTGRGGLQTDFTDKITGKPSAIAVQHEEALNEARTAFAGAQGEDTAQEVANFSQNAPQETIQTDKENVGNEGGYLYNKFVQGVGSLANGLLEVGMQAASTNPLNPVFQEGTIGYYKKAVAPKVREYFREKLGTDADLGSQAQYDNEFWMSAFGGLASSAPAMLTGHAGLTLQAIDGASQSIEANDPEGKLDNTTKMIYSFGLGIIVGALENYGLQKIAEGKTTILSNLIFSKALREAEAKSAGKIGGDLLMKYIESNTKGVAKAFAKAGARGAESFLTEGITGSSQEVATIAAEDLLNRATGESIFDTSKESTWDGFIKRVAYAGAQEGVGGLVMGAGGSLAGSVLNSKARKSLRQKQEKLMSIDTELDKENLQPATLEVLTKRKIELQGEIEEEAKKEAQAQESLSPSQKAKAIDITESIEQAEEALADPALNKEVKKEVEAQVATLEKELDEVISTKEKQSADNTSKSDINNTRMQGKSGVFYIPESIAKKAYVEYNKQFPGSQSYETLIQRGGFTETELDMFQPDWRKEMADGISTPDKEEKAEPTALVAEEVKEEPATELPDVDLAADLFADLEKEKLDTKKPKKEKPVKAEVISKTETTAVEPKQADTVSSMPKATKDFGVVEVIPYDDIDKNKYKPEEQLKFNQGGDFEPVRLVGDPELIELIQMGSRARKKLKGAEVKINEARRTKLEGQFGLNAIDAYDKARELAKTSRDKKVENIIVLGDNLEATKTALPDVDLKDGDNKRRIESLDVSATQGFRVDERRRLKESMLDDPERAALSFELLDFASKIWGKDLGEQMQSDPLSHLGMFFHGDTNSLKEFAGSQLTEASPAEQEKIKQEYLKQTGEQLTQENETSTEPTADTATVIAAAETTIAEATATAETAENVSEVITKIDESLDQVENQLRLLGYYDTSGSTAKDETEIGNKAPERKFKADLTKFAKALSTALGYEHDTDKKGKKIIATTNVPPAGGDGHIILWKPGSEYGVYLSFNVNKDYGSSGYSDELTLDKNFMWRVTTRKKKYSGLSNQWHKSNVTVSEFARMAKREVESYAKNEVPAEITEIAKADPRIMVVKPKPIETKQAPAEKPVETPVVVDPKKAELQKELADAKKAFMATFNIATSGPNPESIAAGMKLVGVYFKLGTYQFGEIVRDMKAEYGDAINTIFEGLKSAYGSYYIQAASKQEMDQMTPPAEVRFMTIDDFNLTEESNDNTENAPVTLRGDQSSMDDRESSDSIGGTLQDEQAEDVSGEDGAGSVQTPGRTNVNRNAGGRSAGSGSRGNSSTGNAGNGKSGKTSNEPEADNADNGKSVIDPNSPEANMIIPEGMQVVPDGPVQKVTANMNALFLLKKLEAEDRNPTPEEKAVLVKFVGWGGLATYLEGSTYDQLTQSIISGDKVSFGHSWNRAEYTPTGPLQTEGRTFEQIAEDFKKAYASAMENPDIRQRADYTAQQKGVSLDFARKQVIASLLTEDEMNAAKVSTENAHYTEGAVIRSMWDLAKHFGFKGGSVLESSAGIGHFFGMMPTDIAQNTTNYGVELDGLTGRMMKKLYPQNNTYIKGFQDVNLTNNSIDLAVGNVPFASTGRIYDARNKDISKFSLHNYFIAKNLRLLKPGGMAILITSKATMDNASSAEARRWFSAIDGGNSDLIGAVRLPNNAFDKNAGTQVTTDVLIFRKRTSDIAQGESISTTVNIRSEMVVNRQGEPEKADIEINEYFHRNPDNMIGKMMFAKEAGSGGLYGEFDATLQAPEGTDVPARLKELFNAMPAGLMGGQTTTTDEAPATKVFSEEKSGKVFLQKGVLYVSEGDEAVPAELRYKTHESVAKDYIPLRDAMYPLLEAELNPDSTDEQIEAHRAKLNKVYDAFAKKHSSVAKHQSWLFNLDIDFPLVAALENVKQVSTVNAKGKITRGLEVTKGDMLSKRVNFPKTIPTKADNIEDAIHISNSYKGHIDLPYVAQMLSVEQVDAKAQMLQANLVFENPNTGLLETKDAYLSGKVRTKLEQAIEAAKENPDYQRNVDALREVQPKLIPAGSIDFKIGVSYLPTDIYKKFAEDLLGIDAKFNFIQNVGQWEISAKGVNDARNTQTYAVDGVTGFEILKDAMTNRATIIKTAGTKDHPPVIKEAETAAAADMQEKINQEFQRYVKKNDEYRDILENAYNERFNNYVEPKTSLPTFEHYPGAVRSIKLRVHQMKAVIRALSGNTLLAHDVGTGKTFTQITIAMEMRRLGLAKKPMIVVKNSTLNDFAASFKKLYPTARILVLSKDEINAKNRKLFFGRIPSGDWDAVIIPQSQFDMIDDKPERVMGYLKEKIEEMRVIMAQTDDDALRRSLEKRIEELNDEMANLFLDDDDKKAAKLAGEQASKGISNRAQKAKAKKEGERIVKLTTSIKKLTDRKTDGILNFDEMGVDALIIDESHSYKRLGFQTNIQKVKGIDIAASKKAVSAYLKTQAVMERTGGKNVVFATGTPVTNTMAELWTNMRFMIPDVIKEMGITTFDQFQQTFTEITDSIEQNAGGNFEAVQRLSTFYNLPELIKTFRSFADVVTTDDIPEFKEDPDNAPPKIKGDKVQTTVLPMTETLRDVMSDIQTKYSQYKNMSGKEKKANSFIPLLLYYIGKVAPIDPRIVNPFLKDDPGSKANAAVNNALRLYKEYDQYKGTQMIFSDSIASSDSEHIRDILGIERGGPEFNLYEDIRDKLIAGGIPAHEIAIMNAKKYEKDEAKKKLFDLVNEGTVRIVIGSTEKMGVGVNAQERMIALHHVDAPGRPDMFTQRNGRIIRQGNIFAKLNIPVEVFAYGMEGTRDSTAFQRLEKKQGFITQLFKGEITERRSEDEAAEDEQNVDDFFAELGASLSGNKDALKLVMVKKDLRKEENREYAHSQRMIDMGNSFRNQQRAIPDLENKIKIAKDVDDYAKSNFPDGKLTEVTIDGKVYTEKLAEELDKAIEKSHKQSLIHIKEKEKAGKYGAEKKTISFKVGNMEAAIIVSSYTNANGTDYSVYLRAQDLNLGTSTDPETSTIFGGRRINSDSATGLLQIIRNQITNAPSQPERWQKLLDNTHKNIAQLTEDLKETYDTTKLENLRKEKRRLDRAILANGAGPYSVKKLDDTSFYIYDSDNDTDLRVNGETPYFPTHGEANTFADSLNQDYLAKEKAKAENPHANIQGVIDVLESAKIKPGQTFSFIVPIPPAMVNGAIDVMIAAIKAGNTAQKAIRAGAKEILRRRGTQAQADEFTRVMTEKYATRIEKVNSKAINVPEQTGIRNADTEEMRDILDLPPVETNSRPDDLVWAEARRLMANGYNFAELFSKWKKGTPTSDVETKLGELYLASLSARIDQDPSQANIDRYNEISRLSKSAGTIQAQALSARRGSIMLEDNLANFIVDEQLANDVDQLDPAVLRKRIEEYKRDEEVRKELEERLKKTQAALSYQKAKNALGGVVRTTKATTSGSTRKTSADFQAERKSALDRIKEKWNKAARGGGMMYSSPIPYAPQLIEIAPDVAVIVKSYVQEGIVNLDEIVRKLHVFLTDEVDSRITQKDVVDLIGGAYNKPPQTKTQLAQDIADLKLQAKLLTKIEKLEAGEMPVKVSARTARNEQIEKLKARVRSLEKGLNPGKTSEEQYNKRRQETLRKKIEQLRDDLRTGNWVNEPEKVKSTNKPDAETQKLIDEHIAFVKETQLRRQRLAHANRSNARKAWDIVQQTLGIVRLVQVSMDWSIPFRQAAVITLNPRHIRTTGTAFKNMFVSTFNPKFYDRMNFAIHTHPAYQDMLDAGIHLNETSSLDDRKRNEDFKNSYLYKIPILREPLLATNRAADAYLNTTRFELYLKMEARLQRAHYSRTNDPEVYEAAAKWVMNATGRGNMLKFMEHSKAQEVLGNTFYGVRLMASRFNLLNPMYYWRMPAAVRKEAMLDMAGYVSVIGITALGCVAAGATVSFDWDEPDFLQVKFGNKTYDLTGGMATYLRTYFRLMSGIVTAVDYNLDPESGDKREYEKRGKFTERSVLKFWQYKLAPVTSYTYSGIVGQDPLYQDFERTDILKAYPMYVDDTREAWAETGFSGAAVVLVPNIFGIGTRNYKDDRNKESMSNQISPELESQVREAKKLMNSPEIRKQMEDAKKQMEEMRKANQ